MSIFQDSFKKKLLHSIRVIENYPKDGILFRDITTLLQSGDLFMELIDCLKKYYQDKQIDFIAGIESRGFIFGSALAYALGVGFVPIRKEGKLPSKTYRQEYVFEYSSSCIEIHQDAFMKCKNPHILLVDDLIATGGTAQAAIKLIKQAGGGKIQALFIIALMDLYQPDLLGVPTLNILEI